MGIWHEAEEVRREAEERFLGFDWFQWAGLEASGGKPAIVLYCLYSCHPTEVLSKIGLKGFPVNIRLMDDAHVFMAWKEAKERDRVLQPPLLLADSPLPPSALSAFIEGEAAALRDAYGQAYGQEEDGGSGRDSARRKRERRKKEDE